MPPNTTGLEKMLAIWNSADKDEQRRLASEALEHNVHFADPNHNIVGREAFLAMVATVQAAIPGARYSRTSRIDAQNNFCRYHWRIEVGQERLMDGFDVTEVTDTGRVAKVIGFFGDLEREA